MQKTKRDELNQACIKMTFIYYLIKDSFHALNYPNDNVASKRVASLLKKSTSLSNFLREVQLPDITFIYFNSESSLPFFPSFRNYYFIDPNWEEYKFFVHDLINQKYEDWSKDKQLTKTDYNYLDKYIKIIDQNIDQYKNN